MPLYTHYMPVGIALQLSLVDAHGALTWPQDLSLISGDFGLPTYDEDVIELVKNFPKNRQFQFGLSHQGTSANYINENDLNFYLETGGSKWRFASESMVSNGIEQCEGRNQPVGCGLDTAYHESYTYETMGGGWKEELMKTADYSVNVCPSPGEVMTVGFTQNQSHGGTHTYRLMTKKWLNDNKAKLFKPSEMTPLPFDVAYDLADRNGGKRRVLSTDGEYSYHDIGRDAQGTYSQPGGTPGFRSTAMTCHADGYVTNIDGTPAANSSVRCLPRACRSRDPQFGAEWTYGMNDVEWCNNNSFNFGEHNTWPTIFDSFRIPSEDIAGEAIEDGSELTIARVWCGDAQFDCWVDYFDCTVGGQGSPPPGDTGGDSSGGAEGECNDNHDCDQGETCQDAGTPQSECVSCDDTNCIDSSGNCISVPAGECIDETTKECRPSGNPACGGSGLEDPCKYIEN